MSTDLQLDQEIMRILTVKHQLSEEQLLAELLATDFTFPVDVQGPIEPSSERMSAEYYVTRHLARLLDLRLLIKDNGYWRMSLPILMEWIRRYQLLTVDVITGG